MNDGSVIVLGGLLEDRYALGQDKVPLMGDLPLVGGLFRNENRSRKKTNLMVFLRPLVIRDAATSDAVMADRYEAIRALQQNTQPAPSTVMRSVSDAPVLPPLRSDTTAPTTPLVPQAPLRTAPIAPLAPEQRALPRPVTSPSDEYTAPPEKLSPQ